MSEKHHTLCGTDCKCMSCRSLCVFAVCWCHSVELITNKKITRALLCCRYRILVSKYGHLAPLAEVDLRPSLTMVVVRWGDRVETVSLRLEQTVGDLKKHLKGLLQLPNGMRLFYIDREMCSMFGPEELKCGTRALHSYGIRDGDEILVVPRDKSRCSSSGLWVGRFSTSGWLGLEEL